MARQASLFCDRSGDALLFDIWFIPDSFIRALDSLDWAAVGLSNGAATRLRKRLRSMHYLSKRTWYIFIQEFRFFSKCPFFLVTVTSPSQTEWNPSPINMWEKKRKETLNSKKTWKPKALLDRTIRFFFNNAILGNETFHRIQSGSARSLTTQMVTAVDLQGVAAAVAAAAAAAVQGAIVRLDKRRHSSFLSHHTSQIQ